MKPIELIASVRKLIGTKYAHQGRSLDGVDCVGAILVVGKQRGIDMLALLGIDETLDYARASTPVLINHLISKGTRLPSLVPAAALLFKMPGAKYPQHFALYTEKHTMIHAEAFRMKSVVENAYGAPWTRILHSMWAVPGVDYE